MPHHDSRHRSRSPQRHQTRDYRSPRLDSPTHPRPKHHPKHHPKPEAAAVTSLPCNAPALSRHDLPQFRPMFALYLDIQKQIDIDDLSEHELKGRWKSFVGKWNTAALSEGWYDPSTLEKAITSSQNATMAEKPSSRPDDTSGVPDDDDEFGPSLPSQHPITTTTTPPTSSTRQGPAIPQLQDLQYHREFLKQEATDLSRQDAREATETRKAERKAQQARLDELLPRATPGTRERQLEKRREVASSNRAFAASKDAGEVELRESDLLGGDDDLTELKKWQNDNERKKSEREVRRDEIRRARTAEREQKVAELRAREEKTMGMLKEIAKARFG